LIGWWYYCTDLVG